MIALFAFLSMNAHAGALLSGGVTAAPSPQAQFVTGVPSLRVGIGSERFHGWTSARIARYHLDDPDFTGLAIEPHLGLRMVFEDPVPGAVVPLANVSTYTRLWAISGEDIEPDEVEPESGGALRPAIGATAAGGLEAIMTENLAFSAEFGVDFFTAGYVFDGWVNHVNTFTTYGALHVNIRL